MSNQITFALPSKGAIAEPTYQFLRDCDLAPHKPNPRQYIGTIPALPTVRVLYQRVKDVLYKVADGTAQIGITGYDVVVENPHDDIIILHDRLGYGKCKLVVAVPDSWSDVQTMAELAQYAAQILETEDRNLRIATTYPNTTTQFLQEHRIHDFTIVKAEGAIEAAPIIGYADIIIDVTQTGTTLRENQLRILNDGVITESQACLVGNRKALEGDEQLLGTIKTILESMDAALNGKGFYQLTVNMRGADADSIGKLVIAHPICRGLLGPTMSSIYNPDAIDGEAWHNITIVIPKQDLLPAIEYLRSIGGMHATAIPVRYVFDEISSSYVTLLEKLNM